MELTLLAPLLIVLLLFVVFVGRLAASQLDVNAAAHAAARAASLQRDPTAAAVQARKVAESSLAGRGLTCRRVDVEVDTGGLRPGGAVTVTVTCHVGLGDLSLLRLPGSRAVTATSSEPIDTWRGIPATATGGFGNPDAAGEAP